MNSRGQFLAVVLMLFVCHGSVLIAADAESEKQSVAGKVADPAADDSQNRERVFTAATLLLAGIVMVGLVMIGFTIIWGARMRRVAKRRKSPTTVIDELWYLKPKKTTRAPSLDPAEHSESTNNESDEP